ncbi:MAG: hypothetical protein IPP72_13745 [Chitinophagaceae bacterium]|nr:hypothetical protein [Chitinophagaceae bacterium]
MESRSVKMELKKKSINKYEAFVYSRNHSLRYYPNYELKEGILGDNWFKTTLKRRISYNLNNLGNVEFRILNDSTTYIRVPAFDNELYSELDSFYRKNDKEIISKPYLIIDVRNNGGGSDRNARPLLKYIYTKPFTEDTVDLYVTEENIKMWELWYGEQSKDTLNFDKDYQVELAAEIDKMKKTSLNSFLQRGDGNSKVTDTIVKYPEKVAIIINKYCASSCETLLFWAKESGKTILVGENSGGYVGYGEVGGLSTPCYNFNLTCTMTRYRNQRKYEVIGIAPDYLLDNSADWIAQTMKILYKK